MTKNNIFYFLVTIVISFTSGQSIPSALEIAKADNNEHLRNALNNILVPRVVGTPSHEQVAKYIRSELTSLGFDVEIDKFVENTPIFSNLTFTNIIGTVNSNADEFVALACHYDSKYFPNDPEFLGATDSAVPCALILNVAKALLPYIQKIRGRSDFGLMLIFFDGEEAFQEWTYYDSVYGSRHLAAKWSNSLYQRNGSNKLIRNIDRIEVLILLDLIGAINPRFPHMHRRTDSLYNQLNKIEKYLAKNDALQNKRFMFNPKLSPGHIDDDHRHFQEQNVPILHLISSPFPKQWHNSNDNGRNLHWPSINDFNRILRVFMFQYLTGREGSLNLRLLKNI